MLSKHWFTLLKLSVFFVFIGRAYQFLFFGAPFRAILWDESLISPIIENLTNYTWFEYATSLKVNYFIEFLTRLSSIILVIGAIVALFWERVDFSYYKKSILYLCVGILCFMGICISKEKNYDILQMFELFIQISLAIALLFVKTTSEANLGKIETILKVALAFTFIAHGIFALGVIYYPANFVDMTIGILGVSENQAKVFLTVAGILDIVVSILIFIPKTTKIALFYVLIWGLLTALARVVFGFNKTFVLDSIHDSLYGTIYRLPHGLIAAIILLIMLKTSFDNTKKSTPTHNNFNQKKIEL